MKTKAFQAFESKLCYFEDDIELTDVIRSSVISGDLSELQSDKILKNIDPTKHSNLTRRQNSDGSRELIVNHLRATIYSAYVKDVYEELTLYLRTVLKQAATNGFDAGRIIGDHAFKIDAKSVLEQGDWDNVARLISDSVFQALESEKSTLKLIKKIATKLALNINEDLINAALPYLKVRHFLVHSDGILTQEFKTNHPLISVSSNGAVILNYSFITKLRDSVKQLVAAFDAEIISSNLLKPEDLQP